MIDLRRMLTTGATDELLAKLSKEFGRRDDWLLLVDNTSDPTILASLLQTNRGRIIFTTPKKLSELPSSFRYTTYVELPPLVQTEGMALLEAMVAASESKLLDDPEKIIPTVLATNFGFRPLEIKLFGQYACGSQRKIADLIEGSKRSADFTSPSPPPLSD